VNPGTRGPRDSWTPGLADPGTRTHKSDFLGQSWFLITCPEKNHSSPGMPICPVFGFNWCPGFVPTCPSLQLCYVEWVSATPPRCACYHHRSHRRLYLPRLPYPPTLSPLIHYCKQYVYWWSKISSDVICVYQKNSLAAPR